LHSEVQLSIAEAVGPEPVGAQAIEIDIGDQQFVLTLETAQLGQEDAARADAAEVERRSALDPDSPMGYLALADVMNSLGEPAKALVAVEKAMRLDPSHPDRYLW